MPKVGVIICQYNFGELTKKCVDSVLANAGMPCDIVVIDDGSKVPYIDSRFQVIRFDKPHGNTFAINAGIMWFDNKYDYIYNLDNDTEIEPNAIKELVDVMEMQPNLAAASSIRIMERNGKTVYIGKSLDILRGCAENISPDSENHLCYWASGCSIMMRSSVIREIGMFDKRLINYCQDTEWCIRACINGYTVAVVPKSRVKHLGEVTMHANLINNMLDRAEFRKIFSGRYMAEILQYLPIDTVTKECGRLTFDTFIEPPTT